MPRVLNVEKLDQKFASLTRSRESIQALSTWIMRHREFYEEIVQQWFAGLSKDFNALTMFYVANDVIQHCGKKKVPEYRMAFSKVLDKAMCLEKVKEIKKEVTRLITLWKERGIYDEEFSQELQDILESTEKIGNLGVKETETSEEEEEASEIQVIARYKQSKLVEDIKKMKTTENERIEKEDILSYAEEPVMPELDDLIVRKECQDMIRKCDTFMNFVEDSIKVTEFEVVFRKALLRDLKDSCIFHCAQSRDVKKVASAFRSYGNKVKVMEKKVAEKKQLLESSAVNNSPCFSEENSMSPSKSPWSEVSPGENNDSADLLKTKQEVFQSPKCKQDKKSLLEVDSSQMKNFFDVLKGTVSISGNETNTNLTDAINDTSFIKEKLKQDGITNLISIEQFKSLSNVLSNISNKENTSSLGNESKNTTCTDDNVLDPELNISNQMVSVEQQNESCQDESISSGVQNESEGEQEIVVSKEGPNSVQPQSSSNLSNSDELTYKDTKRTSDQQGDVTKQPRNISKQTKENDLSKTTEMPPVEPPKKSLNPNEDGIQGEIDFLLEEAYDTKKAKNKLSIKRKIELLLSTKGKKHCTEPPNSRNTESASSQSNTLVVLKDLNTSVQLKNTQVSTTECDLAKADIEKKEISKEDENNKNDGSSFITPEKLPLANNKNDSAEEMKIETNDNGNSSINKTPSMILPEEVLTSTDILINTNCTFTGSDLNFSHLSSNNLKNILNTSEHDTTIDSLDYDDKKTPINTTKMDESCSLMQKKSLYSCDSNAFENVESNCKLSNSIDLVESSVIENKSDGIDNECSSNAFKSSLTVSTHSESYVDKELKIPSSASPDCTPHSEQFSSKVDELEITKSSILDHKKIQAEECSSKQLSNNKKPNLLKTLKNVLECITEKKLSGHNIKNMPIVNQKQPTMPFENCLKIYSILRSTQAVPSNGTTVTSSTTLMDSSLSLSKGDISECRTKDNFDIVDMECDSDD